jgi:hypothetical protein
LVTLSYANAHYAGGGGGGANALVSVDTVSAIMNANNAPADSFVISGTGNKKITGLGNATNVTDAMNL